MPRPEASVPPVLARPVPPVVERSALQRAKTKRPEVCGGPARFVVRVPRSLDDQVLGGREDRAHRTRDPGSGPGNPAR